MLAKSLFGAVCAGVLFFAASSNASAAGITFAGYTNGCFGAGCVPPNTGLLQTATLDGDLANDLKFTNASFGGTSSGGQLLNLTLGTFELTPQGNPDFSGQVFTLRVTFTLPSVIGGNGPSSIFTADLTGAAHSGGGQCSGSAPCGFVTIDFFNNDPIPFSYANDDASGNFSFEVDDLTITLTGAPVGPQKLLGHITNAGETSAADLDLTNQGLLATPEPGSMLLLGTGIVALVYRRWRRKA